MPFTPRNKATNERLDMKLSPDDARKIKRGRNWSAVVTDMETGKKWLAEAAPCDMPECYCDATVTPAT